MNDTKENEAPPCGPALPVMRLIETERIEVTIGRIRYCWCGTAGAVLVSRERGIRAGQLRDIGGTVFKAHVSRKCDWLLRTEIWWSPHSTHADREWIRTFRRALLEY